jgi:hypothetical protein
MHDKIIATIFLALLALGAAMPQDPYPAPCGRSTPSGRCTTETACASLGGFYVGRDCTFYDVSDIGCCYNIPKDEDNLSK